jgi:hypothetical protein
MFIASLFTVAKRQNQPKYPSMDEWLEKMRYYIHSGILFVHRKE